VQLRLPSPKTTALIFSSVRRPARALARTQTLSVLAGALPAKKNVRTKLFLLRAAGLHPFAGVLGQPAPRKGGPQRSAQTAFPEGRRVRKSDAPLPPAGRARWCARERGTSTRPSSR
jgi:hypothetical protein